MRGLLILAVKHKAIALATVAALSVGSAATFASQDVVFTGSDDGTSQVVTQEEATPTPTAVEEATATPTPEDGDEATPTPTPEDVDEDTPTPESTATPEGDEDDDTPRDVVGIPDDNPVKQPEDGDGVCEKGETVIKTTPSGKQVNVPCQAVKEHGHKDKDGDTVDEVEEGTE